MHRINEGPIELFNNRLRPTSEIPSGPTNRRATSRTECRPPLIKPGTDLHNKIRIIEEKNRNYAFQATTTRDKQNQMEITIASLTQDLSNVNSQIESKIEENNNLKEQLSRVEEMNESKTVENNILKDTLEACETNLER